ncbi:MAG: hypothetical protein KDA45_11340, partial [Planctomycetales bacterium]|nr:hypothetical protein [Planctomycetales bacterium]
MANRRAVLSVKRAASAPTLTLADAVGQVAQLSALGEATQAVRSQGKVSLEGVWLGGLAPVAAGWLARDARPMLLLVSQVAEAEMVAAELGELLGQTIDVFPPGSEETELESLAHQETAQRLHVLSRLYKSTVGDQGTHTPPVVVTTLPALL